VCMSANNVMDIKKLVSLLNYSYPNPKTELVYHNEMQLAVAIALSAQTTDKKVNEVTSKLFEKYTTWEDFANSELVVLQNDIHGVNFYKGKADRLIKMARMVLERFGGKLPRTLDDLVTLPGFARKSANVMLKEAWNRAEGIVVDTHVGRVSKRLGLTTNTKPVQVERDLMAIIPKDYWRNFSGAMVLHGRYVCTARKPKCEDCILAEICPSVGSFE
jgi:endonuclease-3